MSPPNYGKYLQYMQGLMCGLLPPHCSKTLEEEEESLFPPRIRSVKLRQVLSTLFSLSPSLSLSLSRSLSLLSALNSLSLSSLSLSLSLSPLLSTLSLSLSLLPLPFSFLSRPLSFSVLAGQVTSLLLLHLPFFLDVLQVHERWCKRSVFALK